MSVEVRRPRRHGVRPQWRHRRSAAAGPIFAALGACSDPAAEGLPLPDLDAELALAAVAPEGASADPRFVAKIPWTAEARYEPEPLDGSVDGFVGGLSQVDLPAALPIGALSLVDRRTGGARPLPPLRRPHVLDPPGPIDRAVGFLPVQDRLLDPLEQDPRKDRLARLLEGVWVEEPCRGRPEDVLATVPRTPAEGFLGVRVGADGTTKLGLVASGTIAVAVFAPGSTEPRIEGFSAPDPDAIAGRQVAVRAIGPREAGRPAFLVLDVGGGARRQGYLLRARGRAFVDDTPATAGAPALNLRGLAILEGERGPVECAFGSVVAGTRDAGVWCRALGGADWSLELQVQEGQTIVALAAAGPGVWLAADRAGAVHQRDAGGWRTVSQAPINTGCRPACAAFDLALLGPNLLAVAGAQAQLARMSEDGRAAPVDLAPVTFVDERPGGERAWTFTAAARAPDGRWWLGTGQGVLLRADPELETFERICLPPEVAEHPITAVAAAPDGRLLLAAGLGQVNFARWDR